MTYTPRGWSDYDEVGAPDLNHIESGIASVEYELGQETARATAAETTETTRATAAETTNAAAISTNATAISTETTRATAAELLAAKKAANLSDLASLPTAKTNLGLGNVDNTSDLNKPLSTATTTALLTKPSLGWAVVTDVTYGAGGVGGDDTTAIQAALNAKAANGGTVFLPAGNYGITASLVVPVGVTIRGTGITTPGSKLATLIRVNIVGAGRGIDMRAGSSRIEGVALVPGASFTGTMVDCTAAAFTELEQVYLQGTASVDLLHLDQATYHHSHKVNFTGGNVQVLGKATQASYSNSHLFTQCRFGDQTTAAFKNVGQAWAVVGGTSEYRADGSAGFYRHDAGVRGESFSIRGLWMGDITYPGPNVQIQWSGDNLHLDGNFFGWNDGSLVQVDENGCNGIVLVNNQFNAFANNNPTYAVDFGLTTGHSGLQLTSCKIYTPLTQVVHGAVPPGSLVDVGLGLSISSTGPLDPANLLSDDDSNLEVTSGSWAAYDITKSAFSRVTPGISTDTAAGLSTTTVAGDVRWLLAGANGKTGTGFMVPVKPGFQYSFSQWVTALDNTRNGDLIAQWLTSAGAFVSQSVSSGAGMIPQAVAIYTKNQAVQVWGTFTAPATAAYVQLMVRAYSTAIGDRFKFGRTVVRLGSSPDYHRANNSLRMRGTTIAQVGSAANAPVNLSSKGTNPVLVNVEPGGGSGGLLVGDGNGSIVASLIPAGLGTGKVTAGVVVRPRAAQTLSSNGAVTIDASLGDAVITLSANATSSTITNPSVDQDLRVTWVQDATGGRTYVWPTACKFAGAAPSDTTANARTTVTFRYDGVNWYEMNRAVAVV